MKICFLLGGFQGNGGIGRVTSILTNEFSKDAGIEIHVICYLYEKNKPVLYELQPGVQMHWLYELPISMTQAILFKHAIKKVKTILMVENIDILIACGALYFPLAIRACERIKTKCVCWEHTNPLISSDYKFQNLCRGYAIKRCDKFVVLTKSAQKYYETAFSKYKDKVVQIYNPINESVKQSDRYDESSTKIISVGRLSYPKNFERLINIAAQILPDYPEWSWDIYGEGELRNNLEKLIFERRLEERVILKGQVKNLYQLYGQYAFMVMTSRYEGFPMVLIEGLANRLPLISFDIQTGPDEIIINEKNGYLINEKSDAEMVSAIRNLILNRELRIKMSESSWNTASKFDMKELLLKWRILWKDLLNM